MTAVATPLLLDKLPILPLVQAVALVLLLVLTLVTVLLLLLVLVLAHRIAAATTKARTHCERRLRTQLANARARLLNALLRTAGCARAIVVHTCARRRNAVPGSLSY